MDGCLTGPPLVTLLDPKQWQPTSGQGLIAIRETCLFSTEEMSRPVGTNTYYLIPVTHRARDFVGRRGISSITLVGVTKSLDVQETVKTLTARLRTGAYGPASFYKFLEDHSVHWKTAVLIASFEEDGPCLCGELIDHSRRLIRFEIEFAGTGTNPAVWGEVDFVAAWEERKLDEQWWKHDFPQAAAPLPNDPIFLGLNLLEQQLPA